MYFSISVAVIVGFLTGIIWYGPLLGDLKQRLGQYSDEELQKATQPGVLERSLLHVVILVFAAFTLSYVVTYINTDIFLEGLWIGFLAGIAFAVVSLFSDGLSGQHQNAGVFMIDMGHWMVVCALMGGILAVLG